VDLNFQLGILFPNNYNVLHNTPSADFFIKKHNIYAGLEQTKILQAIGNPFFYQPIFLGINFGYRYSLITPWEKVNWFPQFDFFLYQVEYLVAPRPSGLKKRKTVNY
jgi:hypothetical protein